MTLSRSLSLLIAFCLLLSIGACTPLLASDISTQLQSLANSLEDRLNDSVRAWIVSQAKR
jgi:predicted PurR-regulated permease PerM